MCNECFFQNKSCKYFPCHKGVEEAQFNCMFCYCPLYMLGERCGGNYTYTKDGIKDCSLCVIPHIKDNYSYIADRCGLVVDETKKK